MALLKETSSRENIQGDILIESIQLENDQIQMEPSNESITLPQRTMSQQFADYSNRLIQVRKKRK